MDITEILNFCIKQRASDLHLSSGMPPMVRIDGQMRTLAAPPLSQKAVFDLVYAVMNDDQRKFFQKELEIDFACEIPELARCRVNAFQQNRGIGAVFRILPSQVITLDRLNAPSVFKDLLTRPRGLILVTGATGSGKTTTLAAMLEHLNQARDKHLLTIEDPIEFVFESKRCLVSQRQVGRDTHGFSHALRSALREDPDYIMIGELRDLETMRLALKAAETGHLVFGTLHTLSAPKTIDRIIEVFPANEQAMVRTMLAESLQAIIAQSLLKKRQGGRCAAHEILIATPAIRNLIRENKIAQMYSTMQTSSDKGMQVRDKAIAQLVKNHVVTQEEALKYMLDSSVLAKSSS